METSLLELLQLGGQKNYEFHYKLVEEKVNSIVVDNESKTINVVIGDPENKDIKKLTSDAIKLLQ